MGRKRSLPAINVRKDLGDRLERLDRDRAIDVDGAEKLHEITILADGDAVRARDLDDLFREDPLTLRGDARCRVAFAGIFEGDSPFLVRVERSLWRAM